MSPADDDNEAAPKNLLPPTGSIDDSEALIDQNWLLSWILDMNLYGVLNWSAVLEAAVMAEFTRSD